MGESLVVIDIETVPVPLTQGELESWRREYLEKKGHSWIQDPSSPSRDERAIFAQRLYVPHKGLKDPIKQQEHFAKQEAAFFKDIATDIADSEKKHLRERCFRIGGCRMISAALGVVIGDEIINIESCCDTDTGKVATFVVEFCSAFYGGFKLIGYNLKSFDIPILVNAFAQYNLRFKTLLGKWDIIDLQEWPFGRRYGLKELSSIFGLARADDEMDGSRVEGMYNNGQLSEIASYNEEDVRLTGELFIHATRVFRP